MSDLARALVAALDPDDLAVLARMLAPYLPAPAPAVEDRWLDTRQAAEHLGVSVHALHRLTAARSVPFRQDAPGGRCYFRRSELDAWRA
jgi:excisionase family DNA binding protein